MPRSRIRSLEHSGWENCLNGLLNSSFSSMNRRQTSVRQTENTVGPQLESPHVKQGLLDVPNIGLCALHIQLMVSSHGRLSMGHFQLSYLKISSKTRFCHFVTHIRFHVQLLSWIMLQSIAQRYYDITVHHWSIRYCSDFAIMPVWSLHSCYCIPRNLTPSRNRLPRWRPGWERTIPCGRIMKHLSGFLSLLCNIWWQKLEITFDRAILW